MKQCPRCYLTYSDDRLNFCLEDGELLTGFAGGDAPKTRYADDAPPTTLLDHARRTNPSNWPASPITAWQPGVVHHRPPLLYYAPLDKTIPTVALVLGILSLPMCWCGWLGLPAVILGFIGKRNADSDPMRYGGRGMAIAGMVMGIVSVAVFILFIIGAAIT